MACGLGCADERPSGVDVSDERPAWSGLVDVGADGWGEDVFAVGDADPDPDGGEEAFAVAPVDVGGRMGPERGCVGRSAIRVSHSSGENDQVLSASRRLP